MRPGNSKRSEADSGKNVSWPVMFTVFASLPELVKYVVSCLSGNNSVKTTLASPLIQLSVKVDV